jgi:predicted PurR-regulated permease PerM
MFAIAALLAYALYPAVRLLQRFLARPVAIITVYLIALGILSILCYMLIRTAIDQLASLIHYVQTLPGTNSQNPLMPFLNALSQFGISQEQIYSAVQGLVNQLQGLVSRVVPLLSSIFSIFISVLLVATLSIYILFDGPRVINWLSHHTPRQQRRIIIFLIDTMKRVVGGYIRGQFLLASVLSTITGIVMALIGVPYPVFLGVLAFVLSFIPVIGAFITGAVCILLALAQGWVTALLALAFLLFLQILEGQVLSPRILGPAVGLHPIVALLALITGDRLFGITGALFASMGAGILQALLIAAWKTWRDSHPEEFQEERRGEQDMQSAQV